MARVTGHVRLIKRKRGAAWYMKYRTPDGRQVQKKLGPAVTRGGRPAAGHYTRAMAENELQATLVSVRAGSLENLPASGATFADAAAEYLRYVEQVREIEDSTLRDYRGVVDRYLLPEFGEQAVEDITPDAIDAYKERLLAEGRISNRVIVRHLTVLHGIFKRAKRVWGLHDNPASADLVERPKVIYTGEFDTFDGEELETLARAAADELDAAIYITAAYTGLRQGELLALRWRDVDFVSGLVHVRRNYTDHREKVPKGKKVRSVPLMPRVADVLARLKEREHFTGDEDLVFGRVTGEHLDHAALRRRFYRALDNAGLRRIRFHDLRHIFGSLAITVLDPNAVQAYMGHQHYSTTQRYLHHQPRPQDALRLQAAVDETVSRTVSRTGQFQDNGEQLREPNTA